MRRDHRVGEHAGEAEVSGQRVIGVLEVVEGGVEFGFRNALSKVKGLARTHDACSGMFRWPNSACVAMWHALQSTSMLSRSKRRSGRSLERTRWCRCNRSLDPQRTQCPTRAK